MEWMNAYLLLLIATISAGSRTHKQKSRMNCPSSSLIMCTCSERKFNYIVDCTNAGLHHVPKNLPQVTTHLILDGNHIKILKNGSFIQTTDYKQSHQKLNNVHRFDQRLGKRRKASQSYLLYISINHNDLKRIEPNAFSGLKKLRYLSFFNNSLEDKDAIATEAFAAVGGSLKTLDIRMNLMKVNASLVDYPVAVSKLKNLSELRIDGIDNKSLPQEYVHLTKLDSISFGGGRKEFLHVAPDMFAAFTELNVTNINMADIGVRHISIEAFRKIPSMKRLDLTNNWKIGSGMVNIAKSLRDTKIEVVYFNNTGIEDRATSVVNNLCGLPIKELYLDKNFIYEIEPELSKCFRQLEILSLGENYLYERSSFSFDFYNLDSLIGLNLTWQQKLSKRRSRDVIPLQRKNIQRSKRDAHICQEGMGCLIVLPSKMKWLDMSHYGLHLPIVPELVIMNNSTLNYVAAASSGVILFQKPIKCPTGEFKTIPQIQTFDYRNNSIQCFVNTLFDETVTHCNWDSLHYLYLGNNKIGQTEGNICNNDSSDVLGFIRPLRNLKHLDLSSNYLGNAVVSAPLSRLSNIEILDLSANSFSNFSLNISQMAKLKLLDISKNNIPFLTKSLFRLLNNLQSRRKSSKIQIDMTGNLMRCSCETIEFLEWMRSTDVQLVNNENYHCVYMNNDNDIRAMNRLSAIIAELQVHCSSDLWLKLSIIILILSYIIITLSTIMFRKRHEIKFIWLKMQMDKDKWLNILDCTRFMFNAFISCDVRDCRLFVKPYFLPNLENNQTKLKFCVAQRDFIIGKTIIANIYDCINQSRKVIVVISKYFLESGWCKEELAIAHQMSLERGRNIMICIFMPGTDQEKLPGNIRMITKTVTCISWPLDIRAQKLFWIQLQKALCEGLAVND